MPQRGTFHSGDLLCLLSILLWASQRAQQIKNPPAMRRHRRHRFNLWIRKIPWKRKWQPPPVFLPGEFHGPHGEGCMLSEIHPIFRNIGAPPTSLPRKRLFQCSCSMTRLGLLNAKARFDSLLNVIYGIVSSPNSYIEGLTIQLPSVTGLSWRQGFQGNVLSHSVGSNSLRPHGL